MRSLLLLALTLRAAAEDFRVEAVLSAWFLNTQGTIQSGIVPVDVETDLGIGEVRPHFTGRIIIKPAARHRLTFEGTSYRLGGDQIVGRDIVFAGQTYRFQDRVVSSADIYYFGGTYEFEIVSGSRGYLGLGGGAGAIDATGRLRSESSGFSGVEEQSFPLPMLQISARYWPYQSFFVGAESKGMTLGDYGYFAQITFDAGVQVTSWLGLAGGFRYVDADVHRRDGTRGIALRFSGPMVSLRLTR